MSKIIRFQFPLSSNLISHISRVPTLRSYPARRSRCHFLSGTRFRSFVDCRCTLARRRFFSRLEESDANASSTRRTGLPTHDGKTIGDSDEAKPHLTYPVPLSRTTGSLDDIYFQGGVLPRRVNLCREKCQHLFLFWVLKNKRGINNTY